MRDYFIHPPIDAFFTPFPQLAYSFLRGDCPIDGDLLAASGAPRSVKK
jgi:hypothetical protein